MKKGFTLIELLVLIAIIAVLSSVILASINEMKQKGEEYKEEQTTHIEGLRYKNERFKDSNESDTYKNAIMPTRELDPCEIATVELPEDMPTNMKYEIQKFIIDNCY